ncbi:CHAT domain-containing protein [Irpex rosettiformis]|uniref:CHAT domain-containing protein n=1 Tax=Irpex rosettiformis TaxID=378272 RepID=A0ACB8U264_9APHY|nr:CHAT domain-containing protein [Irpex rosettiformis]
MRSRGLVAYEQYETKRDLEDLELAIQSFRVAMEATEDNSPEKTALINEFGMALGTRFERVGELHDLEECITLGRLANARTPDDSLDKPSRLIDLGASIFFRFEREGKAEDLKEAIELETCAVDLVSDNHANKSAPLNNLGTSLYTRFNLLGSTDDLEKAIELQTRAVELTPEGHPDKPSRLSNLGNSLEWRFGRLGNFEDLERAIELKCRCVDLTEDGHPDKSVYLNNAGVALQERFQRLADLADIERAITLQTRAVELASNGCPHKHMWLINLGNSFERRFLRLGDLGDLEKAIEAKRHSVDLIPDDHPNKPGYLSDVGRSLQTRFDRLGNLEDLASAIAFQARAVELTPDSHPRKLARLNNAGNSLRIRFGRLGNLEDIDSAIMLLTRAVQLTPDGHQAMPNRLNSLAASLHDRYERTGNLKDLKEAMTHQARAMELTPNASHPDVAFNLSNLGVMLLKRFEQSGNLDDLDQAITHKTNAANLTPETHPDKPSRLYNLANSLMERFNRAGNKPDLEEAIRYSKRSVELLPENSSSRAPMLRLLGLLFDTRLRLEPRTYLDDATSAMEAFQEAMNHTNSHPLDRLRASRQYALCLSNFSLFFTVDPRLTLLEAYQHALNLIPQCIWLGNNVRGRYASEELPVVGSTVSRAAAAAIKVGEYGMALEWLEAGRAVVWSQTLQLRTPLNDLQRLHPKLADDLHRVFQALQHVDSPSSSRLADPTIQPSLKVEVQSSHNYALEFENLVARIREIDGFENFLRPKTLAQLADACSSGPVVVLNVHALRCDALILCHPGEVKHVPLPSFTYNRATELHSDLWSVLKARKLRDRGQNLPGSGRSKNDPMFQVLGDLWKLVVKPIMDVISTLVTLPHVTWCPTGPLSFLPLHAAGIYRPNQAVETVMDVAVSSYTPTIESLLRKRQVQTSSATNDYPRSLVVSQPARTRGFNHIPQTTKEGRIVASFTGVSTDILHDSAGTVAAVLEGMETHDWVHLACHGVQRQGDPINSCFVLYDGNLTLSMLMTKHLPNADLAVLSACQTASGDENLPEEAVHLAAGMLNIGYKSVVGTMWSISDRSGPIVMAKFYEVMAEKVKEGVKELQPAYALHEATKALRKECGVTNFIDWVPFVHFGL